MRLWWNDGSESAGESICPNADGFLDEEQIVFTSRMTRYYLNVKESSTRLKPQILSDNTSRAKGRLTRNSYLNADKDEGSR